MDVFVSALENYPIQSGFILIVLGIIISFFTYDNFKKRSFWDRTPSSKGAYIYAWFIVVSFIIIGIIKIFKNI